MRPPLPGKRPLRTTPLHPVLSSTTKTVLALAVSLLGGCVLAACGGLGDAGGGSAAIDDATATTYAANATQIGGDP